MAVPAAEALININAAGGARAASELDKATGGLGRMQAQQKQVQNQFAKGVQTTGLVSLGRELSITGGLSATMTTGIVGLITTLKSAALGVGGLAVALSVAAAVFGALLSAIAAFRMRTENADKAVLKLNETLAAQAERFKEVKKVGGILTEAQESFERISNRVADAQKKQGLEIALNTARAKFAAAATDTWWLSKKKLFHQIFGNTEALKEMAKAQDIANREGQEALLLAQAQLLGFKDNAERLKFVTDATKGITDAVVEMSDELEQSEAAIRKFTVFDPSEMGKFRNELNATNVALKDQLKTIESGRRKRLIALEELIGKEMEYNRQVAEFAITSEEREQAQKRLAFLERQLAQNRVQINQWAANQVLLANAEASKKTEQMWFERTAKMREAIQQLAMDLMDSFRDSTKTAADAFKALGDFVIKEVQRMIAAEIALQVARKTTASISTSGSIGGGVAGGGGGGGGAGLFGGILQGIVSIASSLTSGISSDAGATGSFQSGGTVPGPVGRPRLAVVHGGETVITPTGRGGADTRRGATNVVNINTGILTPDTLRTAQRQLSRIQGSAGEQVFLSR